MNGEELKIIKKLPGIECMCVDIDNDFVYYGCTDSLYIANVSDPSNPQLVSKFFLKGECRQLTVRDSIVFITAREQGVYIVNAKNPYNPSLICHYDTIELATGVCVFNNILFVAQRQYGVELIDISCIEKPRHMCRIKTGEAQSVDSNGEYLYVGDWGTCELTTINIKDPNRPYIVNKNRLSGYGDGIYLEGDFVFVSTGHHFKKDQKTVTESDDGFGMGHGLEIYSIENPAQPVFLSRCQFPKLYQRIKYDMWSVVVSNDFACCADTHNGVFLIDVKDKKNPQAVGHFKTLTADVTIKNGYIYAACVKEGLLVFDAKIFDRSINQIELNAIASEEDIQQKMTRDLRFDGQVWAVSFIGERALIAAGSEGLIIAELWPEVQVLSVIKTKGFAYFVDSCENIVMISEGSGGVSVWLHENGRFKLLSRYFSDDFKTVRQAKLFAKGKYAIVQCKYDYVVLDLSDPSKPRMIDIDPMLIVYWDQICTGSIDERYTCVFDHSRGIRWIDFEQKDKAATGIHLSSQFNLSSGLAVVDNKILAVVPGGYVLANRMENDLEDKEIIKHEGKIVGKPRICDNILCVSNRITSEVEIIDISSLYKPKLLKQFTTKGTPAEIVLRNGSLIIPDGYMGLQIIDDFLQ